MEFFKKATSKLVSEAISTTGSLGKGAISVVFDQKAKKLQKQIDAYEQANEKQFIRKIAILKGIAHKKNDVFSDKEKLFLFEYILSNRVPNDSLKVELANDLDPSESFFENLFTWIKSKIGFSDLFNDKEEAVGFICSVESLLKIDGPLIDSDKEQINKLCELLQLNKKFEL